MLPTPFRRPVTILAGLGHPRKITRPADALAFLEEYPTRLRDEAYHATIEACRDALSDATAAEEAYDVFSAFAHRRGILVDSEPVGGASPERPDIRRDAA